MVGLPVVYTKTAVNIPLDRLTHSSCSLTRTFGLVVRKMGEMGNDCHLFAEMDSIYPINAVVNLVNKFMTG